MYIVKTMAEIFKQSLYNYFSFFNVDTIFNFISGLYSVLYLDFFFTFF